MTLPAVIHLTEIFGPTLQGEGIWAGTPSTFIRTAGCSVGCRPCDTKVSWPFVASGRHKTFTAQQVVDKVKADKTRHVVITGGEPMECEEPEVLQSIISALHQDCVKVTVELSGSVIGPVAWIEQLARCVDLWSFSPKVASMHPKKLPIPKFIADTVMQALNHNRKAQLKFVVDDQYWTQSLKEIDELLLALFGLGIPKVPLIFQTLTRYKESMHATLDRCRFLFEEAAKDLSRPIGGQYTMSEVRFAVQQHVLVGVP